MHFDYYSYFSNGLGTNHQLDFQTRRVFVAEVLFGAVVLPLRKELMTFMTNDPEPLTENTRWQFCGQFTVCVSMCLYLYIYICYIIFGVYTVYIFRWYAGKHRNWERLQSLAEILDFKWVGLISMLGKTGLWFSIVFDWTAMQKGWSRMGRICLKYGLSSQHVGTVIQTQQSVWDMSDVILIGAGYWTSYHRYMV